MMHEQRDVGPSHSSCEAGEQDGAIRLRSWWSEGAGDQGGMRNRQSTSPDAEPDERDTGAGAHAAGLPPTPEVGAVCGKAARTDLLRGALSNERPYPRPASPRNDG